MKLIAVLSVVAFATVASANTNDFQQRVQSLTANLNSALQQVSSGSHVAQLAEGALKLLKTVSLAGENNPITQDALKKVEKVLQKVQNNIAGVPSSRNSMLNTVADLVGSRNKLIGDMLTKFSENMEKEGNQPLAAIIKTASQVVRERLLANEGAKNMVNKAADTLDMIEDALSLLNNLTGGAHPVLNTAASMIETLDNASDALLGREKDDDSKNMIVSKVLDILYKMKNSKNEAAFEAVEKVCAKLNDARTQSS